MEKLSLIVPLSRIRSSQYFIITIVLLQCRPLYSTAQTSGCHIHTLTGNQQRVYYVPDHTRDFPNNTGWIAKAPSYNTFDSNKECIIDASSGCTVYKGDTIGTSTNDIMYSNGTEGTLYPYQCPIDNYVLLLFLFTTGFAILRIKKQCHFANENIHHHRRIQWSRFYRRVY